MRLSENIPVMSKDFAVIEDYLNDLPREKRILLAHELLASVVTKEKTERKSGSERELLHVAQNILSRARPSDLAPKKRRTGTKKFYTPDEVRAMIPGWITK